MNNQQVYKDKYSNIVSLGCMCSTALYLKKIGVRSCSTFFDWLDGNLKGYLEIIENNFDDVLNKDLLVQKYESAPHIVTNKKYDVSFVHLFDSKKTFSSQEKYVKKYVKKHIDNFVRSLNNYCLLVYYCREKNEEDWIQNNQELLVKFCEQHHCDLIFVFNNKEVKLNSFKSFFVPTNNIHKPFGGPVSYLFEDTAELDAFLISHYDPEQRKKNLQFKPRKHVLRSLMTRLSSHKKDKLVL